MSILPITDFGAIGDGKTLNTAAIQKALDTAGATPGTRVIVPAGVFLTGTIFVHSNTTLEIAAGATILGSPRLADYVPITVRGDQGDRRPWHLLIVKDAHHVTICGTGTIDGNGPAFWEPTVQPPDGDGTAITVVPAREPDPARAKLSWIRHLDNRRPSPMIEVTNCHDVHIEGIHIMNSAGWCGHLHDSEHLWLHGVRVTTNLMGPNNDGFDIEACRDVTINDCHVSCCDDAFVFRPDDRGLERVTVTNCVIRTRCAALKTGESAGHIRQLVFSNCVIYESSRAIALYAGGGTILEDVAISNIVCDTRSPLLVNRPIHIDLHQHEPDQPGGVIRNVAISNMVIRTDGRILMTAQPGRMLENITLRDIHLIYPTVDDPALCAAMVTSSQFSAANPEARAARGAIVAENIRNLVIVGLRITWPEPGAPCPEDWYFPLKTANGTFRVFERSEFHTGSVPDFPVLWGRNLQGGYINTALAAPSADNVPRFDLENCTIAVR